MGLDRIIHLEPFIKIPVQYNTYERLARTCGEHLDTDGFKFCPFCGKEIIEQNIEEKSILFVSEIIGNNNFYYYIDENYDDDYMYLFSNLYSYINTNENVLTIITPDMIKSMINDFSEKHMEDIEILEKKLNMKINVEFGFLHEIY